MRAHSPFSEAYDPESSNHRVPGGAAEYGGRVAAARPEHHQQRSPRRAREPDALVDPFRRLHGSAVQPADADHAGQRRTTCRAMDVSNQRRQQVRGHADRPRRRVVCRRPAQSRVGHRRAKRAPDLALPASASTRTESVLRDGEPRVCRLWRPPVHGDARRASRRARHENREGDLRHRDGSRQGRVCLDRGAARRQGQGDRRHRRRRVRESRISRRVQSCDRRARVALQHDPRARRAGERFVEGRDLAARRRPRG